MSILPEGYGDIDYSGLPCECCKGTLRRYIELGIPTGDAMRAVLVGDLFSAVARLDTNHWKTLRDTLIWIHNEPPGRIYGSKEIVDKWLSHKGAIGLVKECPECDGTNLNEDNTVCFDCQVLDIVGG